MPCHSVALAHRRRLLRSSERFGACHQVCCTRARAQSFPLRAHQLHEEKGGASVARLDRESRRQHSRLTAERYSYRRLPQSLSEPVSNNAKRTVDDNDASVQRRLQSYLHSYLFL